MNKKMFLMATIVITVLLTWVVITNAAPKAYVTYSNPAGNSVTSYVYWDSSTFTTFQWAYAMNSSGGDLNWLSNITPQVSGSDRIATLTLTEYMNYFAKISDGNTVTEDTYVRLFPVNFGGSRELNDYAHGNFRPDSPMCGGCHSTHSALKAQLLKKATYYELCMLCHSNANSQSKYDVESGKITVAGTTYASLAGPISTQYGAISIHNVDDTVSAYAYKVPGSYNYLNLTFNCVSCHNGHGGTYDNYRLLKRKIYYADGQWTGNYVYYDAFATTASDTSGELLSMVRGNTEFCTACHQDFDDGGAWRKGGSLDPVYTGVYMHPVSVGNTVYSVTYNYSFNSYYSSDPYYGSYSLGARNPSLAPIAGDVLPLQFNPKNDAVTDKRTAVVCSTCHYAHGTPKTFGITQVDNSVYESRYMLRMDNYGTCESCHKK